jgi:hypothetical protein
MIVLSFSPNQVLFATRTSASSGFMATQPVVDALLKSLIPASARRVYLVDSGWNLDIAPYSVGDCATVGSCDLKTGVMLAIPTFAPKVSDACLAMYNYNSDLWKCFYGSFAYRFFTTPAFFFEYQLDTAGLGNNGLSPPFDNDAEVAYALETAAKYVTEFEAAGVTGYFNPSCQAHGVIDQDKWSSLIINQASDDSTSAGTSLPVAFQDWSIFGKPVELFDVCADGEYACNPTC